MQKITASYFLPKKGYIDIEQGKYFKAKVSEDRFLGHSTSNLKLVRVPSLKELRVKLPVVGTLRVKRAVNKAIKFG